MKVVVPKPIGVSNYPKHPSFFFGYSNTGDYPEYVGATSYVVGDRVIVDSLQSAFECVADTTGVAPTVTMTTPWVRIGASNAWKPFDGIASGQFIGYNGGNQTVDKNQFKLNNLGRFTTVCVLNTYASWVRVEFSDPDGTNYDKRIDAVDKTPVVDFWTYCFADLNYITNFVFDGIDGHLNSILTITVNNDQTGEPVRVGEIIVGNSYDLGIAHTGVELTQIDFSRKELNDFGDLVLVERPYSQNGTFEISIPAERLSRVQGLVNQLRATPCVWYPSADEANLGLLVYGFPRDWTITYVDMTSSNRYAYATLEIEGLT